MMEDPDLIATLIPSGETDYARDAFRLPYNRKRYRSPARQSATKPTISDRDRTPEPDEVDNNKYDSIPTIRLTFSQKPMDPAKGYCFGTSNKSDVLLGRQGTPGVSRLHFRITFNEKKRLILTDSSRYGTSVSYTDQGKDENRRNFTWILDQKKTVGQWDLEVRLRRLAFKVKLAGHRTCEEKYMENVDRFLQDSRTTVSIDPLGIDSHPTTAQATQPRTPREHIIYISEDISENQLGYGSFGVVDKVINVSTGVTYARKKFLNPRWERDEETRRQQKKKWLEEIRKEVRILGGNRHVSTILVRDTTETDYSKGLHRADCGI